MDGLIFRKVTTSDWPAIEEITRHTWDGGDYIPQVFDEWLADESGAFLAADWEGRLVAIGKVTFLTPGEAWLEGLRVAPDMRGRGIARHFTDHEIRLAKQRGAQMVRYATSSANEAIHKIACQQGMHKIAGYTGFNASAIEGPPQAHRLTSEWEQIAWRFIQQSEVYQATHGLYDTGWKWQQLTLDTLAQRTAYCWGLSEEPSACAILTQQDEERLRVGWLGGSQEKMLTVAHDLRRLAHALGCLEASVMLPDFPDLRATFQAEGFLPWEHPAEIWVFERNLNQGEAT